MRDREKQIMTKKIILLIEIVWGNFIPIQGEKVENP